MLTQKQKDLLMFIHDRMRETGVPPSFDEMKDALDLKSKSGIHRRIAALVERGFIRRLPHRARAIEVIKLPQGVDCATVGRNTLHNTDALEEALKSVIAATRAYLPPDGITAQECLNRILAATDNPRINDVLRLADEVMP